MASKSIIMTPDGLTICPSCMSHIELDPSALDAVCCPFCEESLTVARRQDGGVFGHGVMGALKSSRSAALAAMLGASLSMTACSGTNNPPVEPVYGAPPVEDMGSSTPEDGADEADMKVEPAPEPMPQPEYGVPAVDE